MIIVMHCPHCHDTTAQLLEWHGGIPDNHTRHTCQSCKTAWDEHDHNDELDESSLTPQTT